MQHYHSLLRAGVNSLCAVVTRLTHGLVELNLARTGLTARGVNRLAEALLANRNIAVSLKRLDLSSNILKGEDLTVILSHCAVCTLVLSDSWVFLT